MSERRSPYLRGELTRDFNHIKKGKVFILGGGPVLYFVKSPSQWELRPKIVSEKNLQKHPATLKDLIQIKLLDLIYELKTQSKGNTKVHRRSL